MTGKSALSCAAILALLLASGVTAQENKAFHSGQIDIAQAVFTELERRIICDYYQIPACGSRNLLDQVPHDQRKKMKGQAGSKDKTAMLPPGLSKRDALPPGLERQYQRDGKLPPGLQKRQLPDDLARALPRRGGQYERVIVGNDVLLIAVATGIILDILEGVASGR
ncbi:MAG: hypothetical protein ACOY17_07135 [Pseudomonadota bacterium]|jgi:Ni/Co efflux regulator RcnB